MDEIEMWMARQRTVDARQRADRDRATRRLRRARTPRSFLDRVRGER
ncbi:MAG: hypothetical protein ABWZ76_12060 [Acidimicrobiales bacterium]